MQRHLFPRSWFHRPPDLLYAVLFAIGGLADIERDFEYIGRCVGVLSGVENAVTGRQDLR